MRVVILFSIHLLGGALPLISAVVYRKRFIKLPEGKPNETTPAHFARYGAFLIALLLVSLILGFYIGPKLPNQYGEAAFAFVSGIMTGSFAMVFAFPFFMIGPELKKENKAEVRFALSRDLT